MLKKYVADSLIGFWPVSDRLEVTKLSGKPFNINLIQVYAPTSSQNDVEYEEFYENVDNVVGYTKSGEIVIITGDLNAKVGNQYEYPITRKYGLGKRNVYGGKLINFSWASNLVIANALFQQPKRRLYIWKSPGDTLRNQIDHILINQRYRNCITLVKIYPGVLTLIHTTIQ